MYNVDDEPPWFSYDDFDLRDDGSQYRRETPTAEVQAAVGALRAEYPDWNYLRITDELRHDGFPDVTFGQVLGALEGR